MQATTRARLPEITYAQLFIVFAFVAWLIYSPALDGDFVSDDIHYVQGNRYVHELTAANVRAILDPTGPLPRIVENYAPVHLLQHALVWQVFGEEVRAHHVVGFLMHALASCLLVVLLRRSGISYVGALLGGSFFLVHPANVEAVAWISQLKTTSAMVLCLGALLAHPRRPALALLLFILALLAKPTAAVALFVVIALGVVRSRRTNESAAEADGLAEGAWRWGWVALWGVALVAFSVVEWAAFEQTAGQHQVFHPDLAVRLRTTVAVCLRYIVMAVTSYGVSSFQEPEPSVSLLDPWWLVSLVVLLALAWRAGWALIERREEAAWWVFAVVSFAPVSGFVPLPHIMADRYLYFMLPGLIGAVLLAGPDVLARLEGSSIGAEPARVARILSVVSIIWIAAFAVRSHARAYVWRSSETLSADTVAHYPEGRWARVELAGRAAEAGDVERAVLYLQQARERGLDRLQLLLQPRFAALDGHPGFVALQRELAHEWVARVAPIREPTQSDLMVLAQAHVVLGELDSARDDLRRAIYAGGPMTDYLYQALGELEALARSRSSSEKR